MTWPYWWRASAAEVRLPVEARQSIVVEYEEEALSREAPTYDHSGAISTHSLRYPRLHSGRAVQAWAKGELSPLFKKLDESVIEEEHARLEG